MHIKAGDIWDGGQQRLEAEFHITSTFSVINYFAKKCVLLSWEEETPPMLNYYWVGMFLNGHFNLWVPQSVLILYLDKMNSVC